MDHDQKNLLTRRATLVLGAAAGIGAVSNGAEAAERPVGNISVEQTQVGLIVGASWGKGKLTYAGRSYDFKLKGLGIGELGVATIQARGEVYGLKRVVDFPGTYGVIQATATGGNSTVGKGIWLSNRSGVRLNLRAQRQGLQLTFGADGLVIEMS